MERLYYSAKSYLSHFQLFYCCWFAPVRVGLFIIGYVNAAIDLLYMVEIASDGLEPTILSVQNALIPDYVSKPVPVAAYAIELAFNVVLLCGLYRRDIPLVRVFMYYTILAVVMSFMTYSMVLAAVPLHIQLAIIFSTLFQMYCILLVRSEIVNMKLERKKYELPQLVMSSLPSPTYNYPKKGYHEVTITELPKQQDVHLAIVGQSDEVPETKVYEIRREPTIDIKNGTHVKKETEANTSAIVTGIKADTKVVKRDTTVKSEAVPKDTKNVEAIVEIEATEKKDERSQEDVVKEIVLNKEEKKKMKDDKKKEEKRIKEEKKQEEKKNKEEKKDSKKEAKEKLLQTVTETPKEEL